VITANGDPLEHVEGLTVQGVIEAKNYKFPLLIAFVDGKLVKREHYRTTLVPDGAVVQITHLMGGG
jgi:thiamine biosynthesis protein ThiS